jgi:mono/diheme cytochrome c family protein
MDARMNITRIVRTVAIAVFVAGSLAGCRGLRSSKPPVHLNPNMDNMTYLEGQEPSAFFTDGRAMRPQVDGTVAQGELRGDPHLNGGAVFTGPPNTEGERTLEWATDLPSSVTLTHDLLDRGQDRFGIYCTPCHGEAGLENGGVVPQRAPNTGAAWNIPSLHGARQRDYPIGKVYDIITNGYNTMPGYRAQIPVEDRWAIAAYVRALQVQHESPREVLPAQIRQEQGW